MRHRRLLIGVVVAALIATACAPSYSGIYDANSTTVSGGTGAQTLGLDGGDWVVGSTQHVTRDYTAASWTYPCNRKDNYAIALTAGTVNDPDVGAFGGLVRASAPAGSYPWENPSPKYGYHYCPGIKSETDGVVLDRWHISQVGDGMVFRDKGSTNASDSRFSRSWVYASGDDCVQADSGGDGNAIEENLLQDCWVGISARQADGVNFGNATIDIYNNIISLKDHTSCYSPDDKPCPDHGGWLKWYNQCDNANPQPDDRRCAFGTKAALRNNYFITDHVPHNSGDLFENAPLAQLNDANTPQNEVCDENWLLDYSTDPTDQATFLTMAADWTKPVSQGGAGCTNTHVLVGNDALAKYLQLVTDWHASHDNLIQQPNTP